MCTKVSRVSPRPFNTLPMVVARYMKGQSQARVVMKSPADALWNTILPRESPKMVNTPMQRIPI